MRLLPTPEVSLELRAFKQLLSGGLRTEAVAFRVPLEAEAVRNGVVVLPARPTVRCSVRRPSGCAAASDALDGALARRCRPDRLGRDDTLADALVRCGACAASKADWPPRPVARLALIRSSIPAADAAAIYFQTGRRSVVDALGTSRRLAPVLLGVVAAAPFSRVLDVAAGNGLSFAHYPTYYPPSVSEVVALEPSRTCARGQSWPRQRRRSLSA